MDERKFIPFDKDGINEYAAGGDNKPSKNNNWDSIKKIAKENRKNRKNLKMRVNEEVNPVDKGVEDRAIVNPDQEYPQNHNINKN